MVEAVAEASTPAKLDLPFHRAITLRSGRDAEIDEWFDDNYGHIWWSSFRSQLVAWMGREGEAEIDYRSNRLAHLDQNIRANVTDRSTRGVYESILHDFEFPRHKIAFMANLERIFSCIHEDQRAAILVAYRESWREFAHDLKLLDALLNVMLYAQMRALDARLAFKRAVKNYDDNEAKKFQCIEFMLASEGEAPAAGDLYHKLDRELQLTTEEMGLCVDLAKACRGGALVPVQALLRARDRYNGDHAKLAQVGGVLIAARGREADAIVEVLDCDEAQFSILVGLGKKWGSLKKMSALRQAQPIYGEDTAVMQQLADLLGKSHASAVDEIVEGMLAVKDVFHGNAERFAIFCDLAGRINRYGYWRLMLPLLAQAEPLYGDEDARMKNIEELILAARSKCEDLIELLLAYQEDKSALDIMMGFVSGAKRGDVYGLITSFHSLDSLHNRDIAQMTCLAELLQSTRHHAQLAEALLAARDDLIALEEEAFAEKAKEIAEPIINPPRRYSSGPSYDYYDDSSSRSSSSSSSSSGSYGSSNDDDDIIDTMVALDLL